MWELIRANKRKSTVLIVVMGMVLLGLGYAGGFFIAPDDPAVALFMVIVAAVIWIIMLMTSMIGGERILLATAGAREIQKADAPQLYNIVEEMTIASGLGIPPRVFIIDTPDPNAFAVGLKPERAAVAVTSGLMGKLNRDELQAVIAHEIAHIQNRDTMFMTLAGVTMGAIVILAEIFLRSMRFGSLGGGRRSGGSSKDAGQAMIFIAIIAVVLAILAPLMARLLYFACSRRREYLADACAAQYTRYPEGLASALEKISAQATSRKADKATTSQALAAMYIVNPLAARSTRTGWFSTHPATTERIRILRGMSTNSSLQAYEEAFKKLHQKEPLIPASMLKASDPAQKIRAAAGDMTTGPRQWRDVQDMLHKIDQYAVIACGCSMKIKIPPGSERTTVTCPRCKTIHPLPNEVIAALAATKLRT